MAKVLTAGSRLDEVRVSGSVSCYQASGFRRTSRLSQHSSEQQPARDKETLSTMSAVDIESAAPPALADRVAMVRAQLAPIRSRRALLDSYRRESLCRLATSAVAVGSAAEVIDLAYAMRWAELETETTPVDPLADQSIGFVDE
jgi:hypothetical protein